ncbi:hypothetical protein PG997_011760 [Apiospora hydei]|uniref:Heterokaryon incompatibility domain-containing protein n=1 Tax=Apiospora hydei TaxID=1337664 RepID=A0ABR1V4T9_9PEZI
MGSDQSDGVAVTEPEAGGEGPGTESGTTALWKNTPGDFCVSAPDYSRTDEWPGLPGLHASIAGTGCDFCRFLATTALASAEARQWLEETEVVGALKLSVRWLAQAQVNDDESVAGWLFQVLVWDNDWEYEVEPPFDDGLLVLSFPVTSRSEEVTKSRLFPPPVESSALERAPVEFLRTTLAECAEHSRPETKTTATPVFLPTRLIDVRGELPRIVELSNAPLDEEEDRRYLALSYCWGGASQLLLTRETEADLQAGFSLEAESLAPTQRDTVALARALSVPYVWIDALCIRQGDRADWEAEAANMGRVYGGAYLTVCSVASASCGGGVLGPQLRGPHHNTSRPGGGSVRGGRGTYAFQPLMWSFRSDDAENNEDENDEDTNNSSSNNNNWGQFSLGNSHWSTRAWTFQEMMMSARKLYFTTSGMHFVCGERVHRSEYPYALERETFAEVGKYSIKDNFGLEEISKMEDPDEIYQEWVYWVVMGYGNRQTTNPTDAFPSLSGLAHMFAPLLRDEYVAGLWAKRLASGLLWEPDGTLESLVSYYSDPGPAASYIGPSWTWVARGIVHQETSSFYLPDFVDECEALSAVCVPKGSDPCGELLSASLHVRARAYPAALGCWPAEYWDDSVADFRLQREAGSPSIRCVFDFQTGAEDENDEGDDDEDQAEEEGEEGEEAEDAAALQGCVFILMASYYCHQYELWKLAGLIVHPADDEDDAKGKGTRFIRVGRFTSWFESSEQDIADIREIFGQYGSRDFEII